MPVILDIRYYVIAVIIIIFGTFTLRTCVYKPKYTYLPYKHTFQYKIQSIIFHVLIAKATYVRETLSHERKIKVIQNFYFTSKGECQMYSIML